MSEQLASQGRRTPTQSARPDRYGTQHLERDDRISAQPPNVTPNANRRHHPRFPPRPTQLYLSSASSRVRGDLRHGFAEDLPWPEASFDLVLVVNALHHFAAPSVALGEAFRVLRAGGTFLSIGLDPHERVPNWYVYDFFPETLPRDLERFPSASRQTAWLAAAGFAQVEVKVVEQIQSTHTLDEAHRTGILKASFTSQLTELTESQYSAGIQRIHTAAANTGESFRLHVDLALYATEARRPVAKV